VSRYCFTLQVRADRLAEYRERHAAVWPDMLLALRDAGWRNYSLFLRDDGLLVGVFEADDATAAQAAMQTAEVNARWQAEMAPLFEPRHEQTGSLDASPPRPAQFADRQFRFLDEVFHLETQLYAIGEQP
jgi:L-rhamnose mutarotase